MSVELPFRGTFEIHIFVSPLNAPQEIVDKFQDVCSKYGKGTMKGLFLFLDFRHIGLAGVLQSSRYVTGTMEEARIACKEDSEYLASCGFEVIREKIETVAGITTGVPEVKEEYTSLIETYPANASTLYFEFHIQIENKNKEGFVTQDDEKLRKISRELEAKLGVLVPLSFNSLKAGQRFLNTRTYGLGKKESYETVDEVCKAIEREGLVIVKVIREFIVSDTNKALDGGWLEPLPVH